MRFLRYPGGKTKQLEFLKNFLPTKESIKGNYIEPFVGGGSVFFFIQPEKARLSDLNADLIELYKGIRNYPHKIWEIFSSFPKGKRAYYRIRDSKCAKNTMYYRAAKTLFLNRTCFKGMWRHNSKGEFNVGYGGEERRWAITHENLIQLSKTLKSVEFQISDFENILNSANSGDFIFLDPPYKPGEKELKESHYVYSKFSFDDQIRLKIVLETVCKKKKVKWMMTNSSHNEIKNLYSNFNIIKFPRGTSSKIGIQTKKSQEIIITNY